MENIKEAIRKNLKLFDYQFNERGNQIVVDLKLGLKVIISTTDKKSIQVIPKLMNWNLLTGALNMNLKSSMIYNLIGSFVVFLILFIVPYITMDDWKNEYLIMFFVLFLFWNIVWYLYYFSEFLRLDNKLTLWINNELK